MFALGIFFFATARLSAADLTFFVGGVKPGSISYNNVKTSLDSSPVFGLRVGNSFVPYFGMEHTLAFSTDYLSPSHLSAKDVKGFVYNGNLMFSLPGKNVIPFITAGVGLLHQYGDANLPVGTKFAFNYGGGVKLAHLAGPLGVRVDVRGYRAGTLGNKLNLFEISGGLLLSMSK
jgi:hypothetical protein